MRGLIVKGSSLVFAGAVLAACAGGSFVALEGAPVGMAETPRLDGVYKATVTIPLLGPVYARITAEPTRDGFTANTRPGMAWSMIGGIEGVLGRIFAPFLFPGGVILTWDSASPLPGHAAEGWISAGKIKNARMQTVMTSADDPVELFTRDGRRVGLITLQPARADDPPFANYPELAEGISAAITQRIYDPSLADSTQVRGYMRHVRRIAGLATDDIEFIFGAGAAAHKNIRFPWPIVAKKDDPSLRPEDWGASDLGTIRIDQNETTGVVNVRVEAFLDADDVDAAFERILAMNPTGVRLDLVTCPGVTLASLRFASWLVTEPVYLGTFFTAEHRETVEAGKLAQFPTATISSAESIALAEAMIDLHGAVNIMIDPGERHFDLPMAVLTSDKTATSAEPLVWALKHHSHAKVFGTPTAGHPQISRPFDLGQDWVVWIASADFRPATAERMDRGVEPDVRDRSANRAKAKADEYLIAEAAARSGGTRLSSQSE
jgi:hypothetical protein